METEIRIVPDNCYPIGKDNLVEIEIKENKEDMEEKKIQHYDCFFDREPSKSNLKPFSLEAAKAGKPVCTRDGRKARIICFDKNDSKMIVALIQTQMGSNREAVIEYHNNGKQYLIDTSDNDLMMLPEKKEGWVNIYRDLGQIGVGWEIFPTKEKAIENFKDKEKYITTIKIGWEE